MITKPLPSIVNFLESVETFSLKMNGSAFTCNQRSKLAWLLTAILCTGTLNMETNSAICLGRVASAVLAYFVHNSCPFLIHFWQASTVFLLASLPHKKLKCYLTIDDTDLSRSKVVTRIFGVFKAKHKASGGYANCQRIVVVAMVVLGVRIPLFFCFHRPDPRLTKWHRKKKENDKARQRGKKLPHNLPPKPSRNTRYPTLIEIAIKLLRRTKRLIDRIEKVTGKKIHIVAITFDAAFMSKKAYKWIRFIFPGTQVISQIKSNQLVADRRNRFKSVSNYFNANNFQKIEILIRNDKKIVYIASARLQIKAIGQKLHVVALRYEGETDARYLVATETTWRAKDIVTAYSSRWIIEVLFEDLKQNCGLGRRACLQRGSGSCGTVVLSMIADIYCHSTPDQLKNLSSGVPVYTTGSIARTVRTESLLGAMEEAVNSKEPKVSLKCFEKALVQMRALRHSKAGIMSEHFFDLGPLEDLKRPKKAACF